MRRLCLCTVLRPVLAGLSAALVAAAALAQPTAAPAPGTAALKPVPAASTVAATQVQLLGAAWTGPRAVAVGDHGVVLLSDDGGRQFRQARSVPVSSKLTAVSFADERHGWAVGHWGAILVTRDGGETWQLQRLKTDEDRPLLAVHFFDARRGIAVGLWSLVLTTVDGGASWQEQKLPPPAKARKADLNLLSLFGDGRGTVYASAEQGQVLRSSDHGQTWQYLDTGYKGSLWAGSVLADGSLLVGGQRGSLLRSTDQGSSWQRIATDSKSSVTAMASSGSQVTVVGLDGLVLVSRDGGQSFTPAPRADALSLTGVLLHADAQPLLFSRRGVVPVGPAS